ncbi:carbohydrate-binding module family 21 [Lecanosticta acicola]|uniref:Carbohydrate-binding module family 21 n=1 Tax=Lecanosticta acicola TaxID=111012 RepID=A0AAI8Z4H9_9PEZI|nr:carbohydrate-binding module family 21 [Lecanosticta acicola]
MPYTPPSHNSPASSQNTSPVISRSSSHHQDDIPRSPVSTRPQPPRSHSSSSYLHKHRRSPSFTKSDDAPPTPTDAPDSKVSSTDFAAMGSIRQSPPPVNNLRIPTGAVISPPDSSENSDGEEGSKERGRELEKNWNELQLAVRALPQQREGSPDKSNTHLQRKESASEPESHSTPPTAVQHRPALTAAARKISHSRSSTETMITLKTPTFAESPTQTSDDSDEDEGSASKPALVRKKSGELVKPALRPSSRRRYSSMPGTPTYSKSVHFNDSDNQTRHFLQVDKPIAVSAGSSPVETYDSESEFPFNDDSKKPELAIRIANFPKDTFERRAQAIRVERIFLSADKTTLVGVCGVQNIAFQKKVVARFTLDYWKTTSEVVAEYNNDTRNRPTDGCDRFNFHIVLSDQANIDNKTLLLCVRYNVGGQEFWDNNNDRNFQVDFARGEPKKHAKQLKPVSTLGQRPRNAIPRSRHSPSSKGRQDSVDDDFVSRLDSNSAYHFGSPSQLLGEGGSIKLKQKPKRSSLFNTSPSTSPTNGLGSRYDFGSSLSAALSSAQESLGRRSGLMNKDGAKSQLNDGYFGPIDRTEPAKVDAKAERPDLLTDDRPAMGSDQYKDLVQKFCYFTPGGKGTTSPPVTRPTSSYQHPKQPRTDGVDEADSVSTLILSSGTGSPLPQLDGANERVTAVSPLVSRPSSPSPVTGHALSSASPGAFGYPYQNHRDGYLSDTPTPTAIHG